MFWIRRYELLKYIMLLDTIVTVVKLARSSQVISTSSSDGAGERKTSLVGLEGSMPRRHVHMHIAIRCVLVGYLYTFIYSLYIVFDILRTV